MHLCAHVRVRMIRELNSEHLHTLDTHTMSTEYIPRPVRLEAVIHNKGECSHSEDWSTEVLEAKMLSSHEEFGPAARGFKVFVFAIVLRLQQISL